MEQIAALTALTSGAEAPEELLRRVAAQYAGAAVFTTSLGAEDQVLTDMIARNKLPIRITTLDTGRLFSETYELIQRTESRYKIRLEVFFPEAHEVETMVNDQGINGFFDSVENRKRCCFVRKVQPLRRALAGARIWITGIRREQSENRGDLPAVEWDQTHGVAKVHPLIEWQEKHVWEYLKTNGVPYNPLHDKGFPSIGCAPCTRAVLPGESPRAGRWWWEQGTQECGLHATREK